MNKQVVFASVVFLLAFSACKKDTPDIVNQGVVSSGSRGVLIGCEGNFQFGNASLNYYNYDDSSVVSNVFQSANNRPLGDVLQSICRHNQELYLVMNNSGVVEVVNPTDFSSVSTIKGFTSPRYFLPINNAKAYVSDLYASAIHVVDLNSKSIVKSIKVSGWTEEMVLLNGKAFVCNTANGQIYVVDVEQDVLIDSVAVGSGPTSIVEDKDGMLWVLSGGDSNIPSSASALIQLDPITLERTRTIDFEPGSRARQLKINGNKDHLYFLEKGVQKLDLTSQSSEKTLFVGQGSRNLYGLGIDPVNGNVFVADAIDYIQNSVVYLYDSEGSEVASVPVSVNASTFNY